MINTHIFIIILSTIILILLAEYQKLRIVTWILLFGCITYLLFFLPSRPSNDVVNSLVEKKLKTNNSNIEIIDSNFITEQTYLILETTIAADTIKVILNETEVNVSAQNLSVANMAISRGVVDMNPIDASQLFINDVNTLFCFTAINNPYRYNKVIHTWKYKGQNQLQTIIKVGESPYWRCWSKLTINPNMTGDWQVVATDTLGNYLDSREFSIIPANE